jgi:SAM-dependent methyltransferase
VDALEPDSYGEVFADVYDRWYPRITDAEACATRLVALLEDLGGGPLLELGVGTGRLALPLAARGVEVTGLDSSAAMLQALAGKEPSISTVRADMAEVGSLDLGRSPFAIVLVAYNTLFNLPDEEAQRRCLTGAATHLRVGGRLVVEAFVPPDADSEGRADDVSVRSIEVDEVVLTATLHDPAAQTIAGQHVQITERGIRLRPWRVRYLHLAQLDALATEAGLSLVERWRDWDGSPFDDDSSVHVSVYER